MIRIALNGAGRMAEAVCRAAAGRAGLEVTSVISPTKPGWEGHPEYLNNLDRLDPLPDVLIDFSLPDGTEQAADWCRASGVALLSGVTGLHDAARNALQQAAGSVAVLWSPNLSVGVNLLASLCASVARHMPDDRPVFVHDVHHQWKVDAPSGTALMLGAAVNEARPAGAPVVEYSSERTGEVIGSHSVTFELPGEKLVLSHEAGNRDIFAHGALTAATWLHEQPPGYYTAADWLGDL